MVKKLIKGVFPYVLGILSFLLFYIFFCTATVSGISMYPTLQEGDFLLLSRHSSVEQGDIVAIWSDTLDKLICKRVIGVGNDSVVIKDSKLIINGIVINEPYIKETFDDNIEIKVPEGECYLLGDNRNNSTDSRVLGTFKEDEIVGVCVVNITDICGLTLKDLTITIILIWVLFSAYCALSKLFKRKNENINQE